tara:strand:+ start:1881 stop:2066 length:186 start_codon:yes stop_codon:yes gene_type:complete
MSTVKHGGIVHINAHTFFIRHIKECSAWVEIDGDIGELKTVWVSENGFTWYPESEIQEVIK